MTTELKPPPLTEAQILAIFQPWSDTAGTSHADLMELTVAARDLQWLALVGELQRDAARWRQLAYMEASRVAPETLAHYIARPDRLDFAAKIVAEQTLDAVRNVQSPAIVDGIQSDADRYRWLCSHMIVPAPSLWDNGVGFVTPALPRKSGAMTKPELDAAIDAARGEKGGV